MGLGSLTYVGPGENVFLFIPNLIGYLRVVSLLLPPHFPTALPGAGTRLVCTPGAPASCLTAGLVPQVLAIAAFYYMRTCALSARPPTPPPCWSRTRRTDRLLACSDPWRCCVYYLLSGFMDALDGHAARKWCAARSAAGLASRARRPAAIPDPSVSLTICGVAGASPPSSVRLWTW